MLDLKFVDFINEDMALISRQKLRDAMHDIIVDLKPKQTIDVEEMSNILIDEYKITISPFFLDKFLDDYLKVKRGDKKVNTIFDRNDSKWLGVRDVKGTKEMRNNLLYLKPSLSKHKRRLIENDDNKRLDDIYKSGMKDLSFSEDIIKKSLILQRPEDSIDIIKLIYSDVVLKEKYDNTYDNCWKLMMLIGKNNKLDRVRGWFKLAPESVMKEYSINNRIDYELTTTKKKSSSNSNVKRKNETSPETKKNLDIVDQYLKKYSNWGEFIKDITLRRLIELIEKLYSTLDKRDEFNTFLSKIDELNFILIKYYSVDRNDVITFYKNLGLAGYLKKWDVNKTRPKINDF